MGAFGQLGDGGAPAGLRDKMPLLLSALRQRRFLAALVRVAIARNDDERQSPRMVLLRTTSDPVLLVSSAASCFVARPLFKLVCANKCRYA